MTSVHLSEGESRVQSALKEHPGSTVAELEGLAKASRPTVRNALVKIEARGNLLSTREWPRRYSYVAIPQATPEESEPRYLIQPDNVKPHLIGRTWAGSREKIIKAIEGIDLSRMDKAQVEKAFEAVTKATSGIYAALRQIEDGPEWRQEAGVK
jgi:hypothetical protein